MEGLRLIRITTYKNGNLWNDKLYLEDRQDKAIERFKKANPEYSKYIIVAEDFDVSDPANTELFKAYIRTDNFF